MTQDQKPAPRKTRVKKSETLEVRIPHETKQAFLTACREDGTTASEVVRDQVQSYLDQRARPSQQETGRILVMKLPQGVRRYAPRAAIGGMAAIGLTALAVLPSAAAPDFKAQFGRLDANGDGVLSIDEYLGPKDDDSSDKEDRKIVIETHATVKSDSGDAKADVQVSPKVEMKQQAFAFYLPDELTGGKDAAKEVKDEQHEYKFISRQVVKDGKDDDAQEKHVVMLSVDDIRKEEFATIDANKDGKVSLDEYKAHQTELLTNGFGILDANHDTFLSPDEYAKIVGPPMIKLNWTGDGDAPEPPKIDLPEMKKISPDAIKAAFKGLDANKDGKLSLQEYLPKT